jgi:hypothetical protein
MGEGARARVGQSDSSATRKMAGGFVATRDSPRPGRWVRCQGWSMGAGVTSEEGDSFEDHRDPSML